MIVAASEHGVIGHEGKMPWRLPADLQAFKKLTMGHTLIMGRKTYESIGRPLPGRKTIVLTRSLSQLPGVKCVESLAAAIEEAFGTNYSDETFICGGAEVYRRSFDLVDRLYLTRVHGEIEGDTRVPELDGGVPGTFAEIGEWELPSEGATHESTFFVYDRVARS